MPVFHTKTIESILEPVAQQVSLFLDKFYIYLFTYLVFFFLYCLYY